MSPRWSIRKIPIYMRITDVSEISRRYFFMNAFDGVLTVFGIIVAAYIGHIDELSMLLLAIIGACTAMSLSGFSGAYVTEFAEREKDLKEIEAVTLEKNEDSLFSEASSFASLYVALVDGLAPTLASIPMCLPLFLGLFIGETVILSDLFILTFIIGGIELFVLGYAIGKISDRSAAKFGLVMLLTGIVVGIITIMFESLI